MPSLKDALELRRNAGWILNQNYLNKDFAFRDEWEHNLSLALSENFVCLVESVKSYMSELIFIFQRSLFRKSQ